MLILSLLVSSAWAIGPTKIGPLLPFSGQGIPRTTVENCQSAGKALAEKLSKKSFEKIETGCAGTSAEVGEFVPTINARHRHRYKTEQTIGARRPDAAACQADLNKLTAAASADETLEAECLMATELDYRNKKTDFYQLWATRLARIDDKVKGSIETELRENKSVIAAPPAPSAKPAVQPESKQPTSN